MYFISINGQPLFASEDLTKICGVLRSLNPAVSFIYALLLPKTGPNHIIRCGPVEVVYYTKDDVEKAKGKVTKHP